MRQGIQGPTNATTDGTAVGVPCAPGAPPAACNATTAAAAMANRSIYADTNLFPQTQDIQVRREHPGVARSSYIATPSFGDRPRRLVHRPHRATCRGRRRTRSTTSTSWPIPIDQRNNELKAGTEWVNAKGMVRFDYWGSFFSNDIQTLTWDNPIRATDFNNGLAPPSGPYDPSGYSNGNGPAVGQAALWPSNDLNSVGATGMYKMIPADHRQRQPALHLHAAERGAAAVDAQHSINNPTVLAAFPGLRALPRSSAEAAVNSHQLRWSTSTAGELRFVTIQARYRYNDHENNTPHFDGREYVRFDSVPEEFVGRSDHTEHVEGFSEYFQITRKNFDLNGTFGLRDFGSLRVGYANEQFDREGRGFSDVSENIVPAGVRRPSLQLHRRPGLARHRPAPWRRLHPAPSIDYEERARPARSPACATTTRQTAIAPRAMLVLSANPLDQVGVFFQFTTTRDSSWRTSRSRPAASSSAC